MALSQEVLYLIKLGADMSAASKAGVSLKLLEDAFKKLGQTMESTDKVSIKSARVIQDQFGKSLLSVQANVTKANGVIQQLSFTAQKGAQGMEVLDKGFNLVSKSGKEVASVGHNATNMFVEMAKRALIVAPVWMAIRAALNLLINSLKESIKFMVDFQYALAQVKIVGDISNEDMKKLSRGITELGTKFGGSLKETTDAMILWAQQGKNVNEILELMEPTMKASTINQRSMKDTVEDLTAIMKSYHLEASQVMEVEDKITKIQLGHAISAKDLSEGLRRLAPAAAQYNLTLDQTIGLLTAIQTVTRDTGSVAGRGANTILNRLSKPANVEKVQSISGTKLFLDEAGNATNVITDKFKNQFEILDTLSKKWDQLTVTQKNNIITTIAGTHQYVRGAAILTNWQEALDASKESLNSQGATQKAFGIFLETTTKKAEQLKNAWSQLSEVHEGWVNKVASKVLDKMRELVEDVTIVSNTIKDLGKDTPATRLTASEDTEVKKQAEKIAELARLQKEKEKNDKSSLEISRGLKKEETKLLEEGFSAIGVKRKLKEQLLADAAKSGFIDDKGGITDPDLRIKLKKLTDDISKEKNKQTRILDLQKEKLILSDMLAMGANEIEIQQELIRLEHDRGERIGDNSKELEEQVKLLQLLSEKSAKYSQELKNAISTNLKDVLNNKQDFNSFFANIGNTISNRLQTSLTDTISGEFLKATGLGKIFGDLNVEIESGFHTGAEEARMAIEQGFLSGGTLAANQIQSAMAGGVAGGGIPGVNMTSSNPALNPTGGSNPSANTPSQQKNTGGLIGNIANLFRSKSNTGVSGANATGFNGQAALASTASALFAYQASRQQAKNHDRFGEATSLALAGATVGGPIGAIAGALAGFSDAGSKPERQGLSHAFGLFQHYSGFFKNFFDPIGLFKKPKKRVDVEEETKNFQVASRIDVTNNKLDIVNRNLVALKQSFDTYVLPESAAFATKTSIEDNFSLNARRGLR